MSGGTFSPYRNRYHAECYDVCASEANHWGDWEFTPYSADYPERVQAIVRAAAAMAGE